MAIKSHVLSSAMGANVPPKGGMGGNAEPVFEDRGVDPAEVDDRLEVAVVEVGQARIGADQAGLDPRTGEEYRARGAVVGPCRAILSYPAAELAEAEHQDAVGQLRVGEVVEEGLEGAESSLSSPKCVFDCCEWVS